MASALRGLSIDVDVHTIWMVLLSKIAHIIMGSICMLTSPYANVITRLRAKRSSYMPQTRCEKPVQPRRHAELG